MAVLVQEKVRRDWEEHRIWVDKNCFYEVWDHIWGWLHLDAIKDQMMKHGLVSDHDDMFWISNSSMSPREKADNLLNKIIPKCGKFGYYLLYMCIRDCPGNTLGHGDARRALEDCAHDKNLQPSWAISSTERPDEECPDGPYHPPHSPQLSQQLPPSPVVVISPPPLQQQGILQNVHEPESISDQEVESLVKDKDEKFRSLVCKVYVHLEKVIGGNLNEFKVFVTLCPHSWKHQGITWAHSDLEAITNATTLVAVFLTLNQYWDFIHYELLEIIVGRYGDRDLKREMESYCHEIKELGTTTLNHFKGIHLCKYHPECVPVEAKLSGQLGQYTLRDAQRCRYGLAHAYDLKPHALRMSTVDTGSVILVFLVPAVVSLQMLAELSHKGDIFKELGILRLTIGGRCVYDSELEDKTREETGQLKSEIDGLKKEIKKLELENACTHTELVDSKLKLSNTSKQLKEHKVVIEDLMAENAKLQEGLRKGGIGGWWEVDAHQLLKADGELTLEVGNLLERTGEGGVPKWTLLLQEANISVDTDDFSRLSPSEKLSLVLDTWASIAGVVSVGMFCKVCWKVGAHLEADILEEEAKEHVSQEDVEFQPLPEHDHYPEQVPESWYLEPERFSEQHSI